MKKALSLLVAALLVMGWSGVSEAKNYYASGHAGMVWFDDADFIHTDLDDSEDDDQLVRVLFDSGIAFTGAFGCDFGDVRGELEMGYQVNDVAEAQNVDIDDGDINDSEDELGGDVSLVTFMLNGYYDIPVSDSGLEIFVTAGVGSAFVRFDEMGNVDGDEGTTENMSTWAYQLGAGLALPVADNLMLEARYRYFNTAEFTIGDDSDFFDHDVLDWDPSDDPRNADISSHSALVGLRYNF